jgi:hypothetical protein
MGALAVGLKKSDAKTKSHFRLLISGSQVRVLVRPPNNPRKHWR